MIIIGGAASGGTMALRMARAGWRVALVEKAAFPRRKVCGEFLSATNRPLFRDLGLETFVENHAGAPVHAVAVFCRDEVIEAPMPRFRGTTQLRGLAVGRDRLDDELLRRARAYGATIHQPAKVTALHATSDGHEVEFTGERNGLNRLEAPIVVAAHGSWGASTLPTFPAPQPAAPTDLFGFKAHFANARLKRGLMPCFVFPGGYGGLVETSGGEVSFSCCVRRDELQRIRKRFPGLSPGEAIVRHLVETLRGMREVLGSASVCGSILSTGPIRPGIRTPVQNGVFRIGNAAGEAHPIIAEGITMAMQSAWLLSEAWIKSGPADDPAAVAIRYQTAWRRAFAGRIRASFVFAAMGMNPAVTTCLTSLYKTFPQLLTLCAGASGKAKLVVSTPEPQTA